MAISQSRVPSTESCIEHILGSGVEIGTVIDVGVQTGTPKLMTTLPKARHILFEPSQAHIETIKQVYEPFEHSLHSVALSDQDQTGLLVDYGLYGKEVSHSHIITDRSEADGLPNVSKISELPIRRLDTVMADEKVRGEILLKIDVDGHEISVLRGAPDTLKKAGVVTIEAPLVEVSKRLNFLEDSGFQLFDIVDLCYYKKSMWQVDLVFLQPRLIAQYPILGEMPQGDSVVPSEYCELQLGVEPKRKRSLISRLGRKLGL